MNNEPLKNIEQLITRISSWDEEQQDDFVELLEELAFTPRENTEEMAEIAQTIREFIYPDGEIILGDLPPSDDPTAALRLQEWKTKIAIKVRQLRIKADLTEEELAKKSELPEQYIIGLESGQQSPTHLVVEKLAKALNVQKEDIYPENP